MVLVALAACVLGGKVPDQETAEQFYRVGGYPYGYGAYGAYGAYPSAYYGGAYAFRGAYGYPGYGYGYGYGY